MCRSLLALMVGLLLGSVMSSAQEKGKEDKQGHQVRPKDNKTDPEIKDPKLLALVKKLKDTKAKVRLEAIEDISKMGEEAAAAAKPLCDAMLDRSPQVAVAALKAIENVRPDLYKPLSAVI